MTTQVEIELGDPQSAKEKTEHAKFISLWTQGYRHEFGRDYAFTAMVREGKLLKTLLDSSHMTAREAFEVVKRAWQHKRGFWCKNASTIGGFCTRFNEIAGELPSDGKEKRYVGDF